MLHILLLFIIGIGGFLLFTNSDSLKTKLDNPQINVPIYTEESSTLKSKVNISVPFVSQASTGNWDDPRQQDGCEEAASYMAYLWATGQDKPSATEQEKKIIEISDWEEKTYGGYHDTSAKDTAERILKGYFKYTNFEVKYDIDADDIRAALSQGNIVIAPADGQAIQNPYFTSPGPERHFLLIRGYDLAKDEFITNDNGTKRGEAYRYKTSQLMNALRDYPTGYHEPITENKKAIIIIKK